MICSAFNNHKTSCYFPLVKFELVKRKNKALPCKPYLILLCGEKIAIITLLKHFNCCWRLFSWCGKTHSLLLLFSFGTTMTGANGVWAAHLSLVLYLPLGSHISSLLIQSTPVSILQAGWSWGSPASSALLPQASPKLYFTAVKHSL